MLCDCSAPLDFVILLELLRAEEVCLLELSCPGELLVLRPLDVRTECERPCEFVPRPLEERSLRRRLLDGSRLLDSS